MHSDTTTGSGPKSGSALKFGPGVMEKGSRKESFFYRLPDFSFRKNAEILVSDVFLSTQRVSFANIRGGRGNFRGFMGPASPAHKRVGATSRGGEPLRKKEENTSTSGKARTETQKKKHAQARADR